jgi:hypothetical protein
VLEIYSPKYLNYDTVFIFYSFTYIWASPFINMASVLPILIVKSFYIQKSTKQFSNCYKSLGDGAMRTISSANESMNNFKDAIVYARRLDPSMLCFLK